MSDERLRPTRRGLLALAGGTAVAGCSSLPNPLESSPPRLDGARLSEIAMGELPTVPRTLPLAIDDDHVQRHIDRTRTLLSRAPLPFDGRELPNGAMREEMNTTAEKARTAIERARDAASPLEACSSLRRARGKGHTVATAWAYIDEGLRRNDLGDDADTLAADVAAFDDRWSYVGDEAVRALVVHRTIETLERTATTDADGPPDNPRVASRPETLVTVSEYAGGLERGRAALADATYFYDRLRETLATERPLGPVFEDAAASLHDTLRTATADFDRNAPVTAYVDADVGNSPVEEPLRYLHDDLVDLGSITRHREAGELAAAVLSAHRELTRLRAFDALRERVERGESDAIERADDVAALREAAVAAIETALRETTHPHLSRSVLHDVVELVENADDEIGSYDTDERVPVDWVRRDAGEYIYAAAVAQATPAASATVAEALES
jgi:hypothetical protein